MADVNKLSEIAFNVITNVGMARSLYIEALQLAKKTQYTESEAKIKEGDEFFSKGHSAHLDIVLLEATTLEPQISLLLAHAEDQLMSAETLKIIIVELIELYSKK